LGSRVFNEIFRGCRETPDGTLAAPRTKEEVMNRLLWLALLTASACANTQDPKEEAFQPALPAETAQAPAVPGGLPDAPTAPASTPSAAAEPAREAPAPPPEPPAPRIVDVEVPAGTVLELELLTALDSGVNRPGDEIQARTVSPIYVDGRMVIQEGALVEGRVTESKASGRVKGRAVLGFTFERLDTPGGRKTIRTSQVAEEAESGKKKDAAIVGGSAGVGAIVGGIIGGKKGAAIGAGIGGAGGTGVVLGTKGKEVRLPVGSKVNVRLDEAVVFPIEET
jgi:hypothetical protein